MTPNPKWFEIFNGLDVRISVAVTCRIILMAASRKWFPVLDPLEIQLLWCGFVLFTCLSIFGLIKFVLTYNPNA